MPDGGCCVCEAMMCDGEDRVVTVKKKVARSGGGRSGVIKVDVFRRNALTDPRRRQNRVGKVWLQGFLEKSRRSRERGALWLCWDLGATRSSSELWSC